MRIHSLFKSTRCFYTEERRVGYHDSRSERDSVDAGKRRILLKNFNLFSFKHDLPSPSQDLLDSRLHRKSIPNL